MSVVQRNAGNTTTDNTRKERNPTVEVDLDKILAMGSVGPKRELDATEDAWERSAPILPGRYTIKAYLSKDKPKMGFYDEAKKEPWFSLALECKVQSDDPEVKNTTVFGNVSTRINARKKISTAAGLIAKYGFKLPTEASDIDIVKLLKAALAKERPLDVEIDWKAGYGEADGNWINLANTYADFPDNPEGGKDFVIKAEKKDKSKEDVRAKLFIAHWYGKDEASIRKDGVGGGSGVGMGNSKVNGVAMPTLEDDGPMIPGLVANNQSDTIQVVKEVKQPAKSQVSDDDALAALLEG